MTAHRSLIRFLCMNRRRALQSALGAGIAGVVQPAAYAGQSSESKGGRLNQGVSLWCYQRFMSLDELCQHAVKIGIKGIDLVRPEQYATVKKYGLVPSMTAASEPNTIPIGLNRLENHERVLAKLKEDITQASDAGVKNVITFSGNRGGMPDAEGMANCATGLNKIKDYAKEKNVQVNLELLNSKVDHKDYMADHSVWGVELMKRVDSPNVKLLFDIYHMQIMEGDLMRTIKNNIAYFGHFHTGGNPGRHEIDGTQEVNWKAVAKQIADTGYTGFLSHEFVPVNKPPIDSLAQAFEICTV